MSEGRGGGGEGRRGIRGRMGESMLVECGNWCEWVVVGNATLSRSRPCLAKMTSGISATMATI